MNVEKIIAEVPVTLHQEINEKFSEAVQIHKEYKAKDKPFGDYMDARDSNPVRTSGSRLKSSIIRH